MSSLSEASTVTAGFFFEITLNRPDKRNAINLDVWRAFDEAVQLANRTPGVRAVLIRGAGKSFSAEGCLLIHWIKPVSDYYLQEMESGKSINSFLLRGLLKQSNRVRSIHPMVIYGGPMRITVFQALQKKYLPPLDLEATISSSIRRMTS